MKITQSAKIPNDQNGVAAADRQQRADRADAGGRDPDHPSVGPASERMNFGIGMNLWLLAPSLQLHGAAPAMAALA